MSRNDDAMTIGKTVCVVCVGRQRCRLWGLIDGFM